MTGPNPQSPNWPDHRNKPHAPNRTFFAPPPTDIGDILSAHSTLKTGRKGLSPLMRFLMMALICAPAIAIMFYRNQSIVDGTDDWIAWVILGTALLVFLVPIAWFTTRFKVQCSYVGSLGAVRYTCTKRLGSPLKEERILFTQATALYVKAHSYDVGQVYRYCWIDAHRRILLQIKAKLTTTLGMSKDDPMHFLWAAEKAWSNYVLTKADAELAEHGYLQFTIAPTVAVYIGPGLIEFHDGPRIERCDASDIKSITLSNGSFIFCHRDARWYNLKGRFTFPYLAMPNARVFCLAIERFLPRSTWGNEIPETIAFTTPVGV